MSGSVSAGLEEPVAEFIARYNAIQLVADDPDGRKRAIADLMAVSDRLPVAWKLLPNGYLRLTAPPLSSEEMVRQVYPTRVIYDQTTKHLYTYSEWGSGPLFRTGLNPVFQNYHPEEAGTQPPQFGRRQDTRVFELNVESSKPTEAQLTQRVQRGELALLVPRGVQEQLAGAEETLPDFTSGETVGEYIRRVLNDYANPPERTPRIEEVTLYLQGAVGLTYTLRGGKVVGALPNWEVALAERGILNELASDYILPVQAGYQSGTARTRFLILEIVTTRLEEKVPLENVRILIADDEPSNRDVVYRIVTQRLSKEGIVLNGDQFKVTGDDEEAIAWGRANGGEPLHLVAFLDWNFTRGGAQGLQILEGILQVNPEARIVVAADLDTAQTRKIHQLPGFGSTIYLIPKPFRIEQIEAMVRLFVLEPLAPEAAKVGLEQLQRTLLPLRDLNALKQFFRTPPADFKRRVPRLVLLDASEDPRVAVFAQAFSLMMSKESPPNRFDFRLIIHQAQKERVIRELRWVNARAADLFLQGRIIVFGEAGKTVQDAKAEALADLAQKTDFRSVRHMEEAKVLLVVDRIRMTRQLITLLGKFFREGRLILLPSARQRLHALLEAV